MKHDPFEVADGRRVNPSIEPAIAADIDRKLRAIGFKFVTLDLKGYRLGSLNEGLELRAV